MQKTIRLLYPDHLAGTVPPFQQALSLFSIPLSEQIRKKRCKP